MGGPGGKKGPFGSDSRKFAKFGTDVVHTVLNHFKMGAKIGAPWYCHIAQSNMAATPKKTKSHRIINDTTF